jgi:hypothetical protein
VRTLTKTPLLDLVMERLASRAGRLSESPVTAQALAYWLDSAVCGTASVALIAQAVDSHEPSDYRFVAVLGTQLSNRSQDSEVRERFLAGIDWMQGRKFFVPNRPLSFEADPAAILCFAIGIAALSEGETKTKASRWLNELIAVAKKQEQLGDWERSLITCAAILLDGYRDNAASEIAADMRLALEARGVLSVSDSRQKEAIELIFTERLEEISPERAVARLSAVRWLFRSIPRALPARATTSDVLEILNAVSHALKRWPWERAPKTSGVGALAQRWDVQNEYHVQSLLWALLAPIFPDLEDEEYLKSLGYKHPRADLAIPSMRLIIEVKFLRESTQSALSDITEQIAADSGLYLTSNSVFSELLVFVWDNTRSTEHHSELKGGLLQIAGVKGAAIVARPGGWKAGVNHQERGKARTNKSKVRPDNGG